MYVSELSFIFLFLKFTIYFLFTNNSQVIHISCIVMTVFVRLLV